MTAYEINILKLALLQVERRELNHFKSLPDEEINFSDEFEQKIQEINKKRKSLVFRATKTMPRRVAVAFIAAIITFCLLMTISAIRNPVVNFFIEIHEAFTSLIIQKDEDDFFPERIETKHVPAYFADNGYDIIHSTETEYNTFTIWSNGAIIADLSQMTIKSNDVSLDTENADTYGEHYIGEAQVFYTLKNNTYCVKWVAYGYLFTLTCDEAMGWAEIEKIITSMN